MTAKNPLLEAPPYAVQQALTQLGRDLRTARLRRNLTIEEAAHKIGAGRRAVADAEKGKRSTGIAVYASLLWIFGFLDQLTHAADPDRDEEGLRLASGRERVNARRRKGLDNDF
jgi:transcriptional regulator with XRE-family HTH domain